jgi:hypothetical protein
LSYSGTPSPNPWDLSLSGQSGSCSGPVAPGGSPRSIGLLSVCYARHARAPLQPPGGAAPAEDRSGVVGAGYGERDASSARKNTDPVTTWVETRCSPTVTHTKQRGGNKLLPAANSVARCKVLGYSGNSVGSAPGTRAKSRVRSWRSAIWEGVPPPKPSSRAALTDSAQPGQSRGPAH